MKQSETPLPIDVDDTVWDCVRELLGAARGAPHNSLQEAVTRSLSLDSARRRGVMSILKYIEWYLLTAIAEGDSLNVQGIHEVANAVYKTFKERIPLDKITFEHILRFAFDLSLWPSEALSFGEFAAACSSAVASLIEVVPPEASTLNDLQTGYDRWRGGVNG